MGYDEENLEPKLNTRIKFQKSHTESEGQRCQFSKAPLLKAQSQASKPNLPEHTFWVEFYGATQDIRACSYETLVAVLSEKFRLGNSSKYRIEVWSELYKEWLHMVSFPADNSRLQIMLNE